MKLFFLIFLQLGLFYNYSPGKISPVTSPTTLFYSSVADITELKLYVNLNKAPFDSLYLHDFTEDRNILISGKKIKEFTWEITIPDSIVSNSENMVLLASPYDNKSNSKQMVRFITERNKKKVTVVNVGFEEENNYIYGSYLDTAVFHNELRLSRINNKDSVRAGELVCANFNLIVKDTNADIAVRAENPLFSWFLDANGEKISYDNHLESYINLSGS
jgi:hypothetical protein